jgi:hypothetical protein
VAISLLGGGGRLPGFGGLGEIAIGIVQRQKILDIHVGGEKNETREIEVVRAGQQD